MSGGGGGGAGFSGTAGSDYVDCNIVKRDALVDPVPEVIKTLKKGDSLNVAVERMAGRARLIATADGKLAGILFFQGFTKLIECIEKEHWQYVAVVQNVRGGWCEVEVRPIVRGE
jgi:hypothetical protein